MENAAKGEGTLGKLLHDEELYNELIKTNKSLQELVEDIELHPEKYIHVSAFARKNKGATLTKEEKKLLKELLEKQNNTD
jgi:phospholipid/cholesterol/gamma-HCH transport system substrate-binding protein